MANIYDMIDTWNNVLTTFTAIKMNVTDTASAAGSLLMDLQVGGSSIFKIAKNGNVTLNPNGSVLSLADGGSLGIITAGVLRLQTLNTDLGLLNSSGETIAGVYSGDQSFILNYPLSWSSNGSLGGTKDLYLERDAADTLAQRRAANAQITRGYRTFTNATNYERWALQSGAGYFEWAAETLGTGTDDIDLRLTPAGNGRVDFRNSDDAAAAGAGLLGNAPTAGNPAFWITVKVNGTALAIPAWALP